MIYIYDETKLEDDMYVVLGDYDLGDYLDAVMDLFRSSDEIVWVEEDEED
mgnify:CR=1 FL=1